MVDFEHKVSRIEPPHRHNAHGASVSYASATATNRRILRFEKYKKPAWNGRCGVVALWRIEDHLSGLALPNHAEVDRCHLVSIQ
jgi:hypothetical protein